MFKRIIKGDRDYLKKKRTRVIVLTIIYFAAALSVFLIGYITTGSKRNLLTVVAVLGLLPACKSTVNMIMFLRAKGCSQDVANLIEEHSGRLISMFDMYFTSYSKNFSISHMVVENKVIIGLTEDVKFDSKAFNEHIETMLKNAGHNNLTISVTDSVDKYLVMLDNMNSELYPEDEKIKKDDEIRISLYEISL